MNNSTTTQSWDTLDLHQLKKRGADEHHGPCPVTGEGKDCFWIQPGRGRIGCRSCSLDGGRLDMQQFKAHLGALGATVGARDDLASYDWTNYLTDELVTQTRHGGDPKYRWPKGTQTGGLVYLARHDRTADRPLVFCEGAKAATAAASKLPAADYDVIGFVSASKVPDRDTLTALVGRRSCIVWPDDDLPGAKIATRLVSALARSEASDVVTVDPGRLGLTGGRGHDAEQWHPGGSPIEAFRAACGTAQPGAVEHFQSIWTYASEANPDVLIPGLAWSGRVSKISAAPKLGKTSLIANGIAAWQAGRAFLGEQTGPAGSVLYVSETPLGVLRSWLERYGCPPDAPILAGGSAGVDAIAEAAREHRPDLVIIDSLTDLHAASDSGSLWNAGDVRKLIQPLRALGCAVVLVHHVRKSDGASRDSGDLEAAPDMNISFDPGFSFGADDPPPGPRRLRYFGRWTEPTRALTFTEADGYALASSTHGGGPEGGGGGPFTGVAPVTLLDEKVTGYVMQHPASSGRQIRLALGCQLRDLKPSLARLSAAGGIACDTGPRAAKLWSVTTTGSQPATPMFEPDEPDPVHTSDSVNVYGVEPDEPDPVQPVQTLVNQTPEPDDLLRCDNKEKGKAVAKHAKSCPKCFGSGLDSVGKNCDWRPAEPVVHTEGIKKWDDESSTWVDALESDIGKYLESGIGRGLVNLHPGSYVMDGSTSIWSYNMEERANA